MSQTEKEGRRPKGVLRNAVYVSLVLVVLLCVVIIVIQSFFSFILPYFLVETFQPAIALIRTASIWVSQTTGLDIWLTRAIATLVFSIVSTMFARPLYLGLTGAWVFKKGSRWILHVLPPLACLAFYFLSRNTHFSPDGQPLKRYYEYPDGRIELLPADMVFHYTFGDSLRFADKQVISRFYEQASKGHSKMITDTVTVEIRNPPHAEPDRSTSVDVHRDPGQHSVAEQKADERTVAIIIVNEEGEPLPVVADRVASQIQSQGLVPVGNPFGPTLTEKSMFSQVFEGNRSSLQEFRPSRFCRRMILGRVTSELSRSRVSPSMISAQSSISLRIISVESGSILKQFSVSRSGVGFADRTALQSSLENLAEAICSDGLSHVP
jgi:hypothetical protein